MSLYTWMMHGRANDSPPLYQNIEKYARPIYEQDLSNPRPMHYPAFSGGPTFVSYEVKFDDSVLRQAYHDEIEATVKQMLHEATDEQVALVTTEVLTHLDDQMELTIEEKVNLAFSTLGILSEAEIDEITQT